MGGVPGQPAQTAGLSEHRRGSHAGGAGWGGNAALTAACRRPATSTGRCIHYRRDAAIPRTALRYREYLPCGAAAAGQLLLSGSAVRASRGCCTYQRGSAYRVKEQQPPITFPLRSGGCRGGAYPLWGAWSGVTRERESATGALPLLPNRSRPGWQSDSLRLAPAPLW